MWIRVRTVDCKKTVRIDGLSKLTPVEDLRQKLVEHFDVAVDRQRLFCRGKELKDGSKLFDYDVALNEIIQLLVKPIPVEKTGSEEEVEELSSETPEEVAGTSDTVLAPQTTSEVFESSADETNINSTYKYGDVIDVRDETMGAWFEAKIIKIAKKPMVDVNHNEPVKADGNSDSNNDDSLSTSKSASESTDVTKGDTMEDDDCVYTIEYEGTASCGPEEVKVSQIRPRSRHKRGIADVKIGQRYLVNYNYDDPTARGYWYDAVIKSKKISRTVKEIKATVFIGKDLLPFDDCKLKFTEEIFEIEEPGSQINYLSPEDANAIPAMRECKPECDHCKDDPKRRCKHCSCKRCGDKKEPEKQLVCDECDDAYHIYCLNPPLDAVPDVDDWYCPECKNDSSEVVTEGPKMSKKKSKMASALNTSKRDWGKGMACQGRTKECTIVPKDFFGAIPGIHVGQSWLYRVQVSEAGVHRPHVAGIHGRDGQGAYSIVLSGGYEDDQDNGDTFTYTGSGGRDLSGNKRTAEQSCDQKLTRTNRALAKNCNAPINDKVGAEAKDWKSGKAVRVVRNCKGRKHSIYAPEQGNRYDGIYKVVKYWPEKGKSGFIVWRYLFRRDDETPAPWTKAGKEYIEAHGLKMLYPEGYFEGQATNENDENDGDDAEESAKPKGKGKGGKRKRVESSSENGSDGESEGDSAPNAKKRKIGYKVNSAAVKHIKEDKRNKKLWDEAMESVGDGHQEFISKVTELFTCICCQEVLFEPVTTDCLHNFCKSCLKRSFDAEVYNCATCRAELGKSFKMNVNDSLQAALLILLPGYENGR